MGGGLLWGFVERVGLLDVLKLRKKTTGEGFSPVYLGLNGSTTESQYAKDEVRKTKRESSARKWKLVKGNFRGENGQAAKSLPGESEELAEPRKETMESKARRWKLVKGNFRGENGQAAKSLPGESEELAEPRKETMKSKAKRWKLVKGGSFQGTNGQIANMETTKLEVRKPAMEARAQRWPAKRSAVDVANFLSKK